jgi:PAS domain S-box-containing protein
MIRLDVRSVAISTTFLFLGLVAIRCLCLRGYRSVPGYGTWIASDGALLVSGVSFAFRDILVPELLSIVASQVFILAGFELRHIAVRRFLGAAPQRLASLLPPVLSLIVLAALLLGQVDYPVMQRVRLAALFSVLTLIPLRTMWLLLRRRGAPGFSFELMLLGAVSGLTALSATVVVILSIVRLESGDVFEPGSWTGWSIVMFGFGGTAWSFLSFLLASAWIDLRRQALVEAQRKSDAEFRLLLDECPIPTIVFAPDGRIERVNRAFVEAAGYSLDDLPDEDRWWALASPNPERRAVARRAWHDAIRLAETHASGGTPPEMVADFRNRPSRTIELHAQHVRDRMILQFVDVSDRKAAMQAREEMVAEVSHDLKSPLQSILLRVEALMRNQADPRLLSQARAIRQSVSKMVQMIRDLLDAASLDSGRLRLELAPTDVNEVIDSVVEGLSPTVQEGSTRIECDCGPLDDVLCDRDRLGRVLANLIGNAVKFTRKGTITVRAEQRAGFVLVSIVDTGAGIAPELLPRVFDRYVTTPGSQGGTGLGLHIAKGIVEAHGGRIWVDSTPGRGSTFSFTLPQRPAAQAHVPEGAQAHP